MSARMAAIPVLADRISSWGDDFAGFQACRFGVAGRRLIEVGNG